MMIIIITAAMITTMIKIMTMIKINRFMIMIIITAVKIVTMIKIMTMSMTIITIPIVTCPFPSRFFFKVIITIMVMIIITIMTIIMIIFISITMIMIIFTVMTNKTMTHLAPSLLNEHAPVRTAGHVGGEEPTQAELQEGHLIAIMMIMLMVMIMIMIRISRYSSKKIRQGHIRG